MGASDNVRFGWPVGAAAIALLLGALACATASAPTPTPAAALTDVSVAHDGNATVVDLMGLDHPQFTSYHEDSPDRVVVDLTDVQPDRLADSVAVYDGLVDEVSLVDYTSSSGAPSTRVELTLARKGDYTVVPGKNRLEIRVKPAADAAANAESPAAKVVAENKGTVAAETQPAPAEEAAASSASASPASPASTEAAPSHKPAPSLAPAHPMAPATKLVAIEAKGSKQGAVIHLRADGPIEGVQSFTLAKPPRLVIDLPGLRSEVKTSHVRLESPQARRVRVGQHAKKVRVVIDGGKAAGGFNGRRVVPVDDGLLVTLGSGPDVAAALASARKPVASAETSGAAASGSSVPAAPAEAGAASSTVKETAQSSNTASPASAAPGTASAASGKAAAASKKAETGSSTSQAKVSELAHVHGVQFLDEGSQDRLIVVSDRPVHYQLLKPDPDTLILRIPDATIDSKEEVRVAPKKPGPVSLVRAFAQPDVKVPEVRVVVTRAAGLQPKVSHLTDTALELDFPRSKGVVAKMPPMMAASQNKAATPAAGEPSASSGTATESASAAPKPSATSAASPATKQAATRASGKALASAAASLAPTDAKPPASPAPTDPTQILHEGGLMAGKHYVGRRISLDFKDVDVQDVLRLIADVSNLNIIAGDEVKGKVTIRLVNVPWDQALDVILLTKGLGFIRVGNVLRIAPKDVLKKEEEARLQERRAKEKLEDLQVKLVPVNYADVKEVSGMVKRLLTPRGTVDVDKRTNTVIIKDIPSVIDEATSLIKAVDTQTPQVMISAKIVEANLDFSRQIGTEWGVGSNPALNGSTYDKGFTVGGRTPQTLKTGSFPYEMPNNFVVSNPITSTSNGLLNLGSFLLSDKFAVSLQLKAAESNGEGKVISSPRVVTLDNREAKIEQGVSIPFQTFQNGDAQLEFIDAVLSLKVTPHITADGSIIMKIEVTRNAPDSSVNTPTGSPAIAKNQAKTETLVKNGQTLVLGGIYVVDKSDTYSSVPFLSKIPVIGVAFRNQELSDSRKELLIFVTPRIVRNPQEAAE